MAISEQMLRRRYRTIPGWPRGPKPKRRTELGLLLFGSCITLLLYVIAEVSAKNRIPPHIGPILGVIFGIALVAHLANRWFVPDANAVVLPLAALLNGLGYVVIVSWDPPAAKAQATWAVLGAVLYIATLAVIRHSRDLDRYRYLLLFGAGLLLVLPLVPGVGLRTGTARLFIHFGPVQFQPIEIGKIMLCIFFASYFAENKELLAIPTARFGNRLFIDPRPLIPIVGAWAIAMAVIGVENDIGFAMLIFTVFVVLLWISTGRWAYLAMSILLFVAGAYAAAHVFPQVEIRIHDFLHFTPRNQLGEGTFALAHGGVGGSVLGQTLIAGTIYAFTSDLVFLAVGDALGFAGAACVVIAFVLLIGAGLRIAQAARSDFSKLLATGLTVLVGFQAFFIMAGVVRILPFTGITLPFVAYGGSSLVANYVVIAILMRISQEGAWSPTEEALGVRLPSDFGFTLPQGPDR